MSFYSRSEITKRIKKLERKVRRLTCYCNGTLIQDLGDISEATEIDLSKGDYVEASLTGETTVSFVGLPPSPQFNSYVLAFTGAQVVNFPAGTLFAGGSAPTLVAGLNKIIISVSHDGTIHVDGIINDYS